jgi:6-phosphogluconolactonase
VLNPNFLAVHPSRSFLYSVGEEKKADGSKNGTLTSFAIDPGTGKLRPLNRTHSGGSAPCHLVVDPSSRNLLVANYDGNAAVVALRSDGTLGARTAFVQHQGSSINRERQDSAHAHSIHVAPSNRFVYVPDLGLDRIMVYRFDPQAGSLEPSDPAFAAVTPGSGPRHFAFHPTHRYAYVINELSAHVIAFHYHVDSGVLEEFQSIASLPPDFQGQNTAAEVAVHPSGLFLYVSNRGHDSLVVFGIAPDSGRLSLIQRVTGDLSHPRHFALAPSGDWLLCANRNTDNVTVYQVNQSTGHLEKTGTRVAVPRPTCVRFLG